MNTPKLVSIVLTSYNEEKNIGRTIKDCKILKKFFPIEIILVDAASKDKTVTIAKRLRIDRIIRFPFKRGKGADFWAGGLAAKGNYIIQIDTDHQFQPYEIPLFVKALEMGADIVIGTRFNGGKVEQGSITFRNLLGNWIISLATSIACGRKITDVMAGFKGFRKNAFLALDLKERHFEYEAEVVVKAAKMGMNLVQIPITYTKRVGGISGIKALKDGLNVFKTITKVYFSSLPKYFG
ncbi:glycosyltransferase family 2 protein [Candidatus Daviesbacteria bacterium]|nr:glycosyltransferase family 2 protein [Candidatus Daviesbacteria bacterium]